MSSESNVLPSVEIARLIAERGAATVERMHANVELAREMLASGEIAEPPVGVDPHFPAYSWETTEPRSDLPKRVWLADVLDFATGEGLALHVSLGVLAWGVWNGVAEALGALADHFVEWRWNYSEPQRVR